MQENPTALDDLRRRIDEIDDRVQDLLIERTRLVETVAETKRLAGVPALRPAREAVVLRRLLARHGGRFPRPSLVRLWRELMAAQTGLQTGFAVAVYAPDSAAGAGFWDIARDHFGSHTPTTAYQSTIQVIRAVVEGHATVGVLPMPQEGDRDAWWRLLVSGDPSTPRVVARLPVAGRGNARGTGDALAIAPGVPEPSGADRSLIVLESRGEVSRTRLIGVFAAHGLPCTLFTGFELAPGDALHLLDVGDFVAAQDPRLAAIAAQFGDAVQRILPIGAYPVPFTPAELGVARA
jgi:chorismate mutase / prephenate dehydratase